MPSLANPSEERTDDEPSDDEWRLRWHVADLAVQTAWTSDFATVENLYEQYRRSETHPGTDYTIERRTEVGTEGQS